MIGFAASWKDLVDFKTKGVIFRIINDPISMRLWICERDHYTRIQMFSKLFPSRKYISIVEAKKMSISVSNTVELQVLVK